MGTELIAHVYSCHRILKQTLSNFYLQANGYNDYCCGPSKSCRAARRSARQMYDLIQYHMCKSVHLNFNISYAEKNSPPFNYQYTRTRAYNEHIRKSGIVWSYLYVGGAIKPYFLLFFHLLFVTSTRIGTQFRTA